MLSSRRRLRGYRYGSRSVECLRERGEHREVGVKLDALKAAHAKRRELE